MRSYLNRTILLLALAVCALFTILNFSRMPRQILASLPYLTCDEASVVRAANTIAQNGYSGFRCHEVFIVSCYGGTQSFIDALTIQLVPEIIMNAGQLAKQPGKKWQWLGENSLEVSLLRFSRMLYAAFALLFFFWAGKGLALSSRLLLTLALGSSWSFVEAWLGVKNDYPSFFFLLLFAFFLKKFSQLPSEKRTLLAFLPVFIFGNLGIWVRLPMVVPVFMAGTLFLFEHFREKWKIRSLIRDSAILSASTIVIYLILHPNIFYSSMEMRWMDPTLFIGRAPFISLRERAIEFRLMAFSCWPLLFVARPLLEIARRRKWSFQDRYMFYLFFATLALAALMYQKTQGRSHYYLASTGFAFFLLQSVWQSGIGPSKRALAVFSFLALSSTLFSHLFLHRVHTRGFYTDTGLSESMANETELAAFLNASAQERKEIAVDAILRPVIFEAAESSRKIIYFDSLSESPYDLSTRLGADAKAVVTCWSYKSAALSDEFHSPAGEKWKALLKERCAEYQPIVERAVNPFMGYFKSTKFVVLDAKELRASAGAQILDRTALNPRMLFGAQYGDDTFDTLLRLGGARSLSGKFISNIHAQSLELEFNSACKEEGRVALHLDVDGKAFETSASSDISEEFCRDYSRACGWAWFKRWSQKRYLKTLSLKELGIRPQSKVKVRLDRLAPAGNDCPVLLKMMRFK